MESIQKSGLESSRLPPGWQPRPPEEQLNPEEVFEKSQSTFSVSSEIPLHTGKGTEDTATATLEVPVSYYVIADDTEQFMVKSSTVHVRTLDCIEKRHFWDVLLKNLKLYQDLTNSYNTLSREQIANRQELLNRLLTEEGWQYRLSVLAYTITDEEVKPFAPWQWTGARISFDVKIGSKDDLLEEALNDIPKGTMYFITANLLDDPARRGNVVPDEISDLERKLLDEIFSLNHIPDAPLDDGGTTEPVPVPVPPTIILNEGGFSFEGGSEQFWREGDYLKGDAVDIRDEAIALYPRPGKAYCRTTREEFNINVADPEVETGEYSIYLYSEDRCFRISLESEQLQAKAVCPAEWTKRVEEVKESKKEEEEAKELKKEVEEEAVFEAAGGVELRSPLKDLTNTEQRFSPRKPFHGPRCPIDLRDKENVDPKYFSQYPPQMGATQRKRLQLNSDGVYELPIVKKLHLL